MVTIRKATLDDASTIQSLRRKLLQYQHSVNPVKELTSKKLLSSDELVKTYLERSYSVMYLAYVDDVCVGFIHGTIDPKPTTEITAYLQDLYVVASKRGQGIGSKLLEKLHSFFISKNVHWGLTTDVTALNQKTVDFYSKHGYKLVRKINDVGYFVIEKYVF